MTKTEGAAVERLLTVRQVAEIDPPHLRTLPATARALSEGKLRTCYVRC